VEKGAVGLVSRPREGLRSYALQDSTTDS